MRPNLLLPLLLILIMAPDISAEQFYMNDGSVIDAAYIGEADGVVSILDSDGKRTLQRDDIDRIRWIRVEDAGLYKKAARHKKRFRKEREKVVRKLLKDYSRAKAAERPSVLAELAECHELERISVYTTTVISPKPELRALALAQLEKMTHVEAVVPLVLGAIATRDQEYSDRAHAAAMQKHAEFARLLYEYAAEIPMATEARTNAMDRITVIGDRRSVPTLIATLYRLGLQVQPQRATLQGFRQKPLNLGNTQITVQLPVVDYFQAATTVHYTTTSISLMQRAAVASLQKISGRSFGNNVDDWQKWWLAEQKSAKKK